MEQESFDEPLGRADEPAGSRAAGWSVLYDAALDEMTGLLRQQAQGWAARLRLAQQLTELAELGARSGRAPFAQLEMAGSWQVSQLTATRWRDEAARFHEALPRTLAMLESGELLEHQAKVLLHRTAACSVEVARAVEGQVLPDGAGWCPADLAVRVDRAVLRAEAAAGRDAAELARVRRERVRAQRRTFGRALPDGMGLAGAVLTAEQLVGWTAGMDQLERRERIADRAVGVERTAEQRRADLFAALPSMVLAGTAQDRAAVTAILTATLTATQTDGAGVAGVAGGGSAEPAAAVGSTAATQTDPAAETAVAIAAAAQVVSPATAAPAPAPVADTAAHAAAHAGAGAHADTDAHTGAHADAHAHAVVGALRPWTLGPDESAAQVVLNVHVPVATVLELSDEPGMLERYGPVGAEHVRLLRPRSWRRVLVDADSGRPLGLDDRLTPVDPEPAVARQQVLAMLRPEVLVDADEVGHDPSARLARLVDVRDVRCCGPGCSSTRTHRDHLVPHPHGPTSAGNLGRLSARCHRAKHAGWQLERHGDGSVTWTSPLGRIYQRPSPHAPPPQVDLHADPPPPPPRTGSGSDARAAVDGCPDGRAQAGGDTDRSDDGAEDPAGARTDIEPGTDIGRGGHTGPGGDIEPDTGAGGDGDRATPDFAGADGDGRGVHPADADLDTDPRGARLDEDDPPPF